MATYKLFIHPNEIKKTAFIEENVDEKLIRDIIVEAQDLHIHPLVGTGIYNDIKDNITSLQTSSPDNKTLMTDYIWPALKYWVLYEGVDVLTYKITNKAVLKRTGQNTESTSVEELDRLREMFRNKAEWYSERCRLYLVENQADYPLFYSPGTGVDVIHPSNTSYSVGWYLDKSDWCDDIDKYENPGSCC